MEFEHAVRMSQVAFSWAGVPRFSIEIDAFDVLQGESLFLLGPSGSGKSTLLNLLCGVTVPETGHISILNTQIDTLREAARDRFRAEHFGVIFQMFNLLPYASALDNVLLPLTFAPKRKARTVQDGNGSVRAAALDLLTALKIDRDQAETGLASSLSVGQQQRVAAARALIGRPDIIIADEPTSSLDSEAQDAFMDMLFSNLNDTGASLIFVSHDERMASRFDRVVRLADIARIERGR
ncbi:MAG: ABC transporter ATP-binding protein [Hyphomicrobiales bacterium]